MNSDKIVVKNLVKKEIVNVSKSKPKGSKGLFSLFGFSKLKTEKHSDININNKANLPAKNDENKSNNADGFSFTKFLKNKQAKSAIIVLIFAVVALFILNSSFGKELTSTSTSQVGYTTSLEYCEKLENKIVEVLSEISGVGEVSVILSVESGPELIIANSTDQTTNSTSSGSNATTNSTIYSQPVVVTSAGSTSALIIGQTVPKISGVVVVAEGASDVRIKMALFDAIRALLDVSSENIQIFN